MEYFKGKKIKKKQTNTGGSFRVIATTPLKSNGGFDIHDSSICEVYVPKSAVVLVAKFFGY
jgi:hypothetical protein